MAKRVLVPVDESDQSRTALEVHPDASFIVLHVIDPRDFRTYGRIERWIDLLQIDEQQWDHAEKIVYDARKRAADHGATAKTEVVTGKAPRAIVDYAAEHDVDLIVMGSHGRDAVSRVLFGSVAENVVRRSPTPVTVVR